MASWPPARAPARPLNPLLILLVGIATGVAGALGGVGVTEYFASPGTYCGFFGHCPGLTPAGVELVLGNATSLCAPNGSAMACTYTIHAHVDRNQTPELVVSDLSFSVATANYSEVSGRFSSVTLWNASGCPVATWSASTSSWGAAPGPGVCSVEWGDFPLWNGDRLVVVPIPSTYPSLSGGGLQFVAVGHGPFTGEVFAPFP